eukprot:g25156.t1
MDMDRLGEWTKIWQVEFNLSKCVIFHSDRKYRKATYYTAQQKFQSNPVQRDLGAFMQGSWKTSMYIQQSRLKGLNYLFLILILVFLCVPPRTLLANQNAGSMSIPAASLEVVAPLSTAADTTAVRMNRTWTAGTFVMLTGTNL